MKAQDDEDEQLRSVALRNANSILLARQRAEQDLRAAKEALEDKTRELAHSLSMMRATLESTTDGILVTDGTGAVTDFNERYTRMWRIPAELMLAREHQPLLSLAQDQFVDPVGFLSRVEAIDATAPAETFDVLELADGRIFERFSRIQFVDGRKVGRVWSYRDITERRHAEEALRDETRVLELLNSTGTTLSSKLELQALVQAVTDAATTLSGAQFGAFVHNTADASGDGFARFTLAGPRQADFEKLWREETAPLFHPTFDGAILRCDDLRTETRFADHVRHPSLPSVIRSFLAVPVATRAGLIIGGLFFGHAAPAMFTARTERIVAGVAAQAAVAIDNARLYESAQRAAEERERLLASERSARAAAEHMSDMKDEFLATLSHELRTPLSAILGWSHILRRGVGETDLQQGLETIERNARMQTQLIEDLLDMSRIAAGKVRLDIQPVAPIAFMEAAIETVRPAANAKGIRLEKLLDPTAGPLFGDPGRLQQVVWNLLSNAIKFTPKEGNVQIVLERVNSHIEITIADTGDGISAAFLPHVFERFRQADASTTRRYGGLGLGLSIVKNLVELHGGTVHARSDGEGRGATFSVHLPVTVVLSHAANVSSRLHPRTPSLAGPDFKAIDLSGLRILVVDDEPDARALVKRVLGDCNADVTTAGSGAEALEQIRLRRPHVLVSDIGMPGMDGYELLRRVRALSNDGDGNIPAIALTAFARSEDRTRALRAGFLVHVSKPVEPSELVATVASVAGRTGDAETVDADPRP